MGKFERDEPIHAAITLPTDEASNVVAITAIIDALEKAGIVVAN